MTKSTDNSADRNTGKLTTALTRLSSTFAALLPVFTAFAAIVATYVIVCELAYKTIREYERDLFAEYTGSGLDTGDGGDDSHERLS